ncbi:PAS domain-containing protein [Flavobacterium sp.]|uniref:PAS domain-containing protein n=1 Tax=Flavobacterium sp. TaxID=239 RepID=UPI002618C3AF|nr:PAS domain-containing protein [Flavobacterium sp.]MDG2433512.1 PAS domain-containing protein [Flavobacterium sp.]
MDFCQYEDAVVRYHNTLDIKGMPIHAWPFHFDFINSLKSVFDDVNKLFQLSVAYKWSQKEWDFESKLTEEVVIVTDAKLKIVFASKNIIQMNGYSREEVLGQSPKMFHGQETDLQVSNEIRLAIQNKQAFEKKVLNYKKNGETYQCLIKGYPVFNHKGDVSHFIAFEKVA